MKNIGNKIKNNNNNNNNNNNYTIWTIERQKEFLLGLQEKLNYNSPLELIKLSSKQFRVYGGSSLITKYKGSIKRIIKTHFPQYEEQIHLKERKLSSYWEDKSKQRDFLLQIQQKNNWDTIEGFYNVNLSMILKEGGKSLLKRFNFDLISLLKSNFPEIKWERKNFTKIRKRMNQNNTQEEISIDKLKDEQRKNSEKMIMKEVEKYFNINQLEEWNKITYKQFLNSNIPGARTLIKRYNGSLFNVLQSVYPDHKWLPIHRKKVTQNYWNSLDHQREFIIDLSKKLDLKSANDWSKVPYKLIEKSGGRATLSRYNFNIYFALKTLFPNLSLDPSLFNFRKKNRNLIPNANDFLNFFRSLALKYQIKRKEDWYRISITQLRVDEGSWRFESFPAYLKSLKQNFPDQKWVTPRFITKNVKAAQRSLVLSMKEIFPTHLVIEDYHNPKLKYTSNLQIELDVFLPSFNFGMEYNGEQHYDDIPSGFNLSDYYKSHDEEKIKICGDKDIKILVIPYWWDKRTSSILSLVENSFRDSFGAICL